LTTISPERIDTSIRRQTNGFRALRITDCRMPFKSVEGGPRPNDEILAAPADGQVAREVTG
jgi:hypothetical protein